MPRVDHRAVAIGLGLLTLAALAVFVAFPRLDLTVSGWFYRPGDLVP